MTKTQVMKLLKEIPADLIEASYVVELVLTPKVQMKYNEKILKKYEPICRPETKYDGFRDMWLQLPSRDFKIVMEDEER